MTHREFVAARGRVLAGEDPPQALVDECRRALTLMVRTSGLPAHYSPLGVWSDEAIEEVFADWTAIRLVERGQLRAMLQRSPVLKVFRRMCETSVRQHLIDGLQRSQSANLFERITTLVETDERFASTGSGSGRLWRLVGGPGEAFSQSERGLLAVAWSLGEFEIIRYDPEAHKLSPLLDAGELDRFVIGMLGAGAMTVGTVVRAIQLRFSIDAATEASPLEDDVAAEGRPDPLEALLKSELVAATLAELTERQAQVLIRRSDGAPVRVIAEQLGCSTGTISHELRIIEEVLARLGSDAPEVLKDVLDALLMESE